MEAVPLVVRSIEGGESCVMAKFFYDLKTSNSMYSSV